MGERLLLALLSCAAGILIGLFAPAFLPGAQEMRLALADGIRPAILGLAFGLAGGLAAGRLIRNLLYGVQPTDASVFVGVAVLLLGVAVAACLMPALRASRLHPVQALRME